MKKEDLSYKRDVSITERVWTAAHELSPPFANQMVIEGSGAFDLERWRRAVERACRANPGSRVVFGGFLGRSKWIDSGRNAPVRMIDDVSWSGYDPEGAEFLNIPLDYKKGPSCDVLLLNSKPPRAIFRSLHAVMDGRGTQSWALDVFRALRGDALKGADSRMTDSQLLHRKAWKNRISSLQGPLECLIPTGKVEPGGKGISWKRIRIKGRYKALTAQLACLISQAARQRQQQRPSGIVRIHIPVDLRFGDESIRSNANLTGMIHVDIPSGASFEVVSEMIKNRLNDHSAITTPYNLKLIKRIPIRVLNRISRKNRLKVQKKGLASTSGVISNLGKIPLELYSEPSFRAESIFFIPPGTESTVFFTAVTGTEEFIELVCTSSNAFAAHDRLEGTMTEIAEGLKQRQDSV